MAKLVIRTNNMDEVTAANTVMLTLLKLLIIYNNKKKDFWLNKWQPFLCSLFPDLVQTHKGASKVWQAKDAMQYLLDNKFATEIQKTSKNGSYSLYKLNKSNVQRIISVVTKNAEEYDNQLIEEANTFFDENDNSVGGGNYNFDSLFG